MTSSNCQAGTPLDSSPSKISELTPTAFAYPRLLAHPAGALGHVVGRGGQEQVLGVEAQGLLRVEEHGVGGGVEEAEEVGGEVGGWLCLAECKKNVLECLYGNSAVVHRDYRSSVGVFQNTPKKNV